MKLLLRSLLPLLILTMLGPSVISASPASDKVTDWSAEAAIAKSKHQPIMLLFTSSECHYCDRLEREVIAPMRRGGKLAKRVHLREFNIDRGGKLVDFDGEKVRARLFVSRYQVYATPTVILIDHQGRPLSEPIVGYNGKPRYLPILQRAIERSSAYATLQALGQANPVR